MFLNVPKPKSQVLINIIAHANYTNTQQHTKKTTTPNPQKPHKTHPNPKRNTTAHRPHPKPKSTKPKTATPENPLLRYHPATDIQLNQPKTNQKPTEHAPQPKSSKPNPKRPYSNNNSSCNLLFRLKHHKGQLTGNRSLLRHSTFSRRTNPTKTPPNQPKRNSNRQQQERHYSTPPWHTTQ